MKSSYQVWFLCLVLAPLASSKLEAIQGVGGVLNVYYQDMLLFHHSPDEPVVSIGNGETNYTEVQGSFEVDDLVTEKVPLNIFTALSNPDNVVNITFESDSGENIQVEMHLSSTDQLNGDSKLTIDVQLVSSAIPNKYNRIWLSISAETSERIYGAGEQYTYFNLRGHTFPIFITEQGIGRDYGVIANASNINGGAGGDYYTTYWPQASFLSAKDNAMGDKYSLLLDNREYLVFDFTNSETHDIFAHSTHLSGTMFYSQSIKRLIPMISDDLGRQPMLPDWTMKGAILGLQRGMDEVKQHYNEAKEAKVDIAGLWIQDWSGGKTTNFGHRVYWNWKWNETYYPGLDVFIQELLMEDVYMTVYANTHLIEGSDLFVESNDLNYLLMDADGDTYLQDFGGFNGGTIDFFNEDARVWYRDTLQKNIITDLGCAGWMADFGEYTAVDMVSNNTMYEGETLHNALPVAWAQTNREIVENSNTTDTSVFWMRAGGLGSSGEMALAWNGDQNVDFSFGDGLPSTIVATLNLAVSGMGICHFDIGGYTTELLVLERSEELLLRSAEYAVFTPIMRTHEGNMPSHNVQFYSTQEVLIPFARLTQIHTRLFNYTKELVRQNAQQGIPVQRPMFYEFSSDAAAWDVMYQYMYGPDLIVAPVLYEDATNVEVYIPGGDSSTWIHIWGGIGGEAGPFVGPMTVTIQAPVGLPAVLYRSDSMWASLFEGIGYDFGAANP